MGALKGLAGNLQWRSAEGVSHEMHLHAARGADRLSVDGVHPFSHGASLCRWVKFHGRRSGPSAPMWGSERNVVASCRSVVSPLLRATSRPIGARSKPSRDETSRGFFKIRRAKPLSRAAATGAYKPVSQLSGEPDDRNRADVLPRTCRKPLLWLRRASARSDPWRE